MTSTTSSRLRPRGRAQAPPDLPGERAHSPPRGRGADTAGSVLRPAGPLGDARGGRPKRGWPGDGRLPRSGPSGGAYHPLPRQTGASGEPTSRRGSAGRLDAGSRNPGGSACLRTSWRDAAGASLQLPVRPSGPRARSCREHHFPKTSGSPHRRSTARSRHLRRQVPLPRSWTTPMHGSGSRAPPKARPLFGPQPWPSFISSRAS